MIQREKCEDGQEDREKGERVTGVDRELDEHQWGEIVEEVFRSKEKEREKGLEEKDAKKSE